MLAALRWFTQLVQVGVRPARNSLPPPCSPLPFLQAACCTSCFACSSWEQPPGPAPLLLLMCSCRGPACPAHPACPARPAGHQRAADHHLCGLGRHRLQKQGPQLAGSLHPKRLVRVPPQQAAACARALFFQLSTPATATAAHALRMCAAGMAAPPLCCHWLPRPSRGHTAARPWPAAAAGAPPTTRR